MEDSDLLSHAADPAAPLLLYRPPAFPAVAFLLPRRALRLEGDPWIATMLSLRQVFLPFTAPLNPSAPTEQQRKQLELATALGKSVHGCDAMEAAAKANNSSRPADPGDVRLEGLSGPMRGLLATLTPGEASKPLVSSDGIALVMICNSAQKNLAESGKEEISNRLLNDRVELVSRQLVRDLRRRAVIDQRS